MDSEETPVEIEAVRSVEAPATASAVAATVSAETTVTETTAETATAVAPTAEAPTAETATAETATAVTPVTGTPTADSEGPVGQTERVKGTVPTATAEATESTAEPTFLQKVYNWLMS